MIRRNFIAGILALLSSSLSFDFHKPKVLSTQELIDILINLFSQVEIKGERVAEIRLSPMNYVPLRLASRDYTPRIEKNTNRLREGYVGYLWGSAIRVKKGYNGICVIGERGTILHA